MPRSGLLNIYTPQATCTFCRQPDTAHAHTIYGHEGRPVNVLSLPLSVSIKSYGERCFSSSLTGSSNVSEKNAACFSPSACTPLAANLSTNQLLISSICFSSVTGLIGSRKPCWHPQYLCSFPTTPFLLWHSFVSNPFCQSKLPGQRSFAYQGPVVWNKLPHSIRHASSTASFKTVLKLNSAVNKMCHNIFRSKCQDSIGTLS